MLHPSAINPVHNVPDALFLFFLFFLAPKRNTGTMGGGTSIPIRYWLVTCTTQCNGVQTRAGKTNFIIEILSEFK